MEVAPYRDENYLIAEAVKRFRKINVYLRIKNGKVELNQENIDAISKIINVRATRLGFFLHVSIQQLIEQSYHNKHKRYYLRKEPKISEKPPQTQIPLGFLYKLSLKNLNKTKCPNKKKVLRELLTISSDFATILDLQRTNPYDSFNIGFDIIPYLRKNLLHDEFFTLQQYNAHSLQVLTHGLYNKSKNKQIPSDIDLSIYLDIFDTLNNYDVKHIRNITQSDFHHLTIKYGHDKVESSIRELSHNKINTDYNLPFDTNKLTYNKFPFFESNDVFHYYNTHFHGEAFLLFLQSKLKSLCEKLNIKGNKFSDLKGSIMESFIENLLSKHGVKFTSGKTYKIKDNLLKDIGINTKDGECDFIIETDCSIIFIEAKSKELVSYSKGGDSLNALYDIFAAFIKSQEQICKHEYVLRSKGKIKFDDNTELTLNNRNIEKISLTLFDFQSISDISSIRHILTVLMNSIVSSESDVDFIQKNINQINKSLESLRKYYQSDIFKKVYYREDGHMITEDSKLLSCNQLITILLHSSNNEEFLSTLNKIKRVANSSQDWYLTFNHFAIDLHKSL